MAVIICILAVTSMGISTVSAAAKKGEQVAPLTATGSALEKKHAEMLKTSQAAIGNAPPRIGEQKIAAHQKACEVAKAAESAQ